MGVPSAHASSGSSGGAAAAGPRSAACLLPAALVAHHLAHPRAPTTPSTHRLGAFRGLGRDNAVARFSRHVLDALPKTHSAGAGGAAGDLLAEKLATHQLLLQVLGDAGALKQLHATVLRLLFEDGQRLAALVDVQQLESELHRGGAGGGEARLLVQKEAAASAMRTLRCCF